MTIRRLLGDLFSQLLKNMFYKYCLWAYEDKCKDKTDAVWC